MVRSFDCQKCDYFEAYTTGRAQRLYSLCFFCITKGIKPNRKQYMKINKRPVNENENESKERNLGYFPRS